MPENKNAAATTSSVAMTDTPLASRNAAGHGSVTSTGLYESLGTGKSTKYGRIVKPTACFQMMAIHCSAPLPLTILDILGPCLLPTTFSAVLFAGGDGTVRVPKWARNLTKIQRWMEDQERVQVSSQQHPGRQPLSPSARNSLSTILLEDIQ